MEGKVRLSETRTPELNSKYVKYNIVFLLHNILLLFSLPLWFLRSKKERMIMCFFSLQKVIPKRRMCGNGGCPHPYHHTITNSMQPLYTSSGKGHFFGESQKEFIKNWDRKRPYFNGKIGWEMGLHQRPCIKYITSHNTHNSQPSYGPFDSLCMKNEQYSL